MHKAELVGEGDDDGGGGGGGGLCAMLFGCGKNNSAPGGGGGGSKSVVKFDIMELADADATEAQLHDHAGKLLSIERPEGSKLQRLDTASIHGEEESHAGQLERELEEVHKELTRLHMVEDGSERSKYKLIAEDRAENRIVANREVHDLHKQAEAIETQLQVEMDRLNREEKMHLAEARLHNAKKAVRKGASNVFTINEQGSLGLDWHFQDGHPVLAAIREGGSGSKLDGLRVGMVLAEYRQPQLGLKSKVDFAVSTAGNLPLLVMSRHFSDMLLVIADRQKEGHASASQQRGGSAERGH